jgi:hypothetical protein
MTWHVDNWDPAYGMSDPAGVGSGPDSQSSAQVDPDVETPAASWQPMFAPGDVRASDVVLFTDGVRRVDAGMWRTGDDGVTHRGLAASYAAGVVRCDLRAGVAGVTTARIARGVFTSSPAAADLVTGAGSYVAHQVKSEDKLEAGVQAQMDALEVGVATHARSGGEELLVIDGPLRRGKLHLGNTLGYVKTHRTGYLPPPLSTVVTSLAAGQRTPVFGMGTQWPRYAWYVRLPGPRGGPWSGVVRVECSAELSVPDAITLADLSAVTLPRFASTAYKDPRAPQNLVPIAGLERKLRAMLGDAKLLQRMLVLAARQPAPAAAPAPAPAPAA